jgi:bifunctional UDP-N-acetylglucosamine pyrophosphorylase/glucosamine-1-phosphate N-acetyltransferase
VWLPEGALAAVVAAGPGSLAAAHVDEPSLYGVLELRDGRAVRVHEKSADPPSKLANAGVYHAPAGFARLLAGLKPSPRGELEVTDALQASFDKTGGWRVVEVDDWLDVGRPWDLLAAAERALAEVPEVRRGTIEAGATLKGKVVVAEGALVKAGAYVEGPVYIGARSVVGPNCYLRPGTVLLEDTKVGNGCEIKASLLMAGTHAAHLSYVGDSVLGERVNLGAGTLVANLRHDGKTVRVTQEGQRVDTRRRKLGVILGDDVHTGINTSLNVGVMLPAGAATRPGEVVMESRV